MVRVHRGPPEGVRTLTNWRGAATQGSSVSQPCHALAELGGYRRSQEDTKTILLEYRRNLADTTGHERTRHHAGSGP